MAIVRWEPARELSSLQQEVNRLFNSVFDGAPVRAGESRRWVPAMDLHETEDSFLLRADLPGVAESDLSIEVEDGTLTVSGKREDEHSERRNGAVRIERQFGSFTRSLTLPKGVDAESIDASFDRGVLEIRIPKPQADKPRKVAISVGASKPEQPAVTGTSSEVKEGDAA